MSDMNFRDRLDSEMKNIVFTDKSRNKVLARAAGHGNIAGHKDAGDYGNAAGHGNADVRGMTKLHEGAVDHGNADIRGMTKLHEGAVDHGNADAHVSTAASPDRRASGAKLLRERLYSFMNLELRIPVKPLVVALLITVSGIVYACVGIARVSAEDIRNSSISVVDSNQGGQADGIYKN